MAVDTTPELTPEQLAEIEQKTGANYTIDLEE